MHDFGEFPPFSHFLKMVAVSDFPFVYHLPQVGNSFYLYRGQEVGKPLLPHVAEDNPKVDHTDVEKIMLGAFHQMQMPGTHLTDLEVMCLAQHYGMHTRLLDWTTNPLVALWFACNGEGGTANKDAEICVYKLFVGSNCTPANLDSVGSTPDLWRLTSFEPVVIRPSFVDARVQAQQGWFTLHPFDPKGDPTVDPVGGCYTDIRQILETEFGPRSGNWVIPKAAKPGIMRALDRLGVNYSTVFPGLEGSARYLNWCCKQQPIHYMVQGFMRAHHEERERLKVCGDYLLSSNRGSRGLP